MNRTATLPLLVCSAILAAATPTRASVSAAQPASVVPSDTFDFAVYGGNNSSTNPTYLIQPLTATFGTTQTFSGTGAGGAQNVTISSNSSYSNGTRTDTISVNVPANFDPTGTTTSTGGALTYLALDLGGGFAGTNTIDFLNPVSSPTYAGSVLYGANSVFPLPASAVAADSTFTNNNSSLFTTLAIDTAPNDISAYAVHGFNFSITYADAVPEPSTGVLAGVIGSIAGVVWLRRRWQAAA